MKNYFIYEQYKVNINPSHHDDRNYSDEGQDEVYEFAKNLFKEKNLETVVDIGCGSGFKLMKYFKDEKTLGLETEPCLSQLKKNYPNKEWLDSGEPEKSFPDFKKDCDLIICADVVEHILNPDDLLNYIKSYNFKYLIISTPDRKILRDKFISYGEKSWNGPPLNPSHVREWEFTEFENYLNSFFKKIKGHHCERQIECMYFLCENEN